MSRVAPGLLDVRWSFYADCMLPAGMAIDAATGTISGTPSQRGSYWCGARADIANNGVSWTQYLHVSFDVQEP